MQEEAPWGSQPRRLSIMFEPAWLLTGPMKDQVVLPGCDIDFRHDLYCEFLKGREVYPFIFVLPQWKEMTINS